MKHLLFLFGPWDLAAWSIAVMLALIAIQMLADYLPSFFNRRLVSKAELERLRDIDRETWINERLHDDRAVTRDPALSILDDFTEQAARRVKGKG